MSPDFDRLLLAANRNAPRKVIREHLRQESTQDLEGLLAGNDQGLHLRRQHLAAAVRRP